ncbi:MAG TPA: type II toxin-antitoxin system VapB family antitoxin, partial [Bryobacteraceae bacterium]|nr:type II toxin-antitoxin system VapB family antitoxin [Bryobacteraceae bacterium]
MHFPANSYVCQRPLSIGDDLPERAREATRTREKTALVQAALEALITREAAKRLAALGGSPRKLSDIPRRRNAGWVLANFAALPMAAGWLKIDSFGEEGSVGSMCTCLR